MIGIRRQPFVGLGHKLSWPRFQGFSARSVRTFRRRLSRLVTRLRRKRKPGISRPMVRIFFWVGLLVTAAGVTASAFVFQAAMERGFERSAVERSAKEATHVAHIFYYTVWAPVHERIPGIAFREAAHPLMMETFSRRSTYGLGIVSLQVWGLDGALIWSSDPAASAGSGGAMEWHDPVATRGETVSRIYLDAAVTDMTGQQARMDVVRTYTPVYDSPVDEVEDGSVIGVLELTMDVSADRAAARSALWWGVGVMAASASALFALAMVLVVRSAGSVDTRYARLAQRQRRIEKGRVEQVHSAKLAVVGEMVASVAHELNNPLTGIWGVSQLALKRDLDPRARRDLEVINQEADRSVRIVQNILSFSRARAAEKAYVSVNAAVEAALELRRYQLVVNNILMDVRLDPHLPRTMADPHKLQQVAINLINNAEQAMMESKGGGRLSIETKQDGEWVRFTVADTGPGIAPADLERIFDPFFSRKGKGTGLGLSISYSIVEEHGGSIQVESQLGEGTKLHVMLPILRPADEDVSGEDDQERKPLRRRSGKRRQGAPALP